MLFRSRGQRGWVVDKAEGALTDPADGTGEVSIGELVARFLSQFYGEQAALAEQADAGGSPVPREVLVPELPAGAEDIADWLSTLRGAKVSLRVPQRGDKKALMETVARNAAEAFTQHKLRRAGDLSARSAALQELQEALGLDSAPLRIECVDVSHHQGSDVVASLVVFEDGLARKSEYRRFAIREGAQGGDVGSIAEVTRRRFARYQQESAEEATAGDGPLPGINPETGRPRKFAYPPNLYVVDGGAPQVAAASDVLAELGITDVAVIGLAKRLEEVWLPGEPDPAILPRSSEALYLLQRVRDEAHRFAITYHKQKSAKRMSGSVLDGVPGLGRTRKSVLLKHFGSVKRLRLATVDEISSVPGFGRQLAETVYTALNVATPAADNATDIATGNAGDATGDAAGRTVGSSGGHSE